MIPPDLILLMRHFTAACYKMSNNPLTNLLFALVVYHGTIVCVGICSYTSNHLNSSEPKDVNLRNIIVITAWLFHVFLSHVGLPSHPQHELMKRQCTGCPGMITFYIKGKLNHASAFLSNLKVIWQYIFIRCLYLFYLFRFVSWTDRTMKGEKNTSIQWHYYLIFQCPLLFFHMTHTLRRTHVLHYVWLLFLSRRLISDICNSRESWWLWKFSRTSVSIPAELYLVQ